jgi:hypothetical protein
LSELVVAAVGERGGGADGLDVLVEVLAAAGQRRQENDQHQQRRESQASTPFEMQEPHPSLSAQDGAHKISQ